MQNLSKINYGEAILQGFEYLLEKYPEVFIIGQGLWSPWYVGNSMKDLDKKFGVERVLDSPVSELACTGAAIGASLYGYKPIVVHPRIDFMLYAIDPIVNQAAKWSHMFNGKSHAAVTIRGIINRGGCQGAQHSQALHSWFAHIPGLKVVMPATVKDARDLLIASVLSQDPVVFIDDRWLYEQEDTLDLPQDIDLNAIKPKVIHEGRDITLVGSSYSTLQCTKARAELLKKGIDAEVIDLRVINPLNIEPILKSVTKTGNLCVVDGSWSTCGLAGEIIAAVSEKLPIELWKSKPIRVTLPDAPAPCSKVLEEEYYFDEQDIVNKILNNGILRNSNVEVNNAKSMLLQD